MTSEPAHAVPKYVSTIIFVTLLVFLANAGVFFYVVYLASQQPTVKISDVTQPKRSVICPGETLDYQFTLNVNKAATVDVSTSFHLDGNLRPSFVRLQQFIFPGATTFVLVRHTVIPPSYEDPESGTDIPWTPGKYAQRTIINIEGRSTGAEDLEVPFEIKSSCK